MGSDIRVLVAARRSSQAKLVFGSGGGPDAVPTASGGEVVWQGVLKGQAF